MKNILKSIIILIPLFLLTSCTKNKDINEFQELYNVETTLVNRMSYDEFLAFTEDKTGVVFIGDQGTDAKSLAKIFCDTLCECDVNKAHFVKKDDIDDEKLLEIFGVDSLNYPIIVAYKMGELVGYYDNKTETKNTKKFIDEIIHEAYPTVCTDAC